MIQPEHDQKLDAASRLAQPEIQPSAECAADLSAARLLELQDEAKQTEYRRLYLLQLQQRQGCLGCGD